MKRAIVALAIVLGAVFGVYALRFFAVTPGNDFVGDLGYADLLADSLRHGRIFPDWIANEAFGRPTTVQRGSTLLFLPVALLELLGLSSLAAAKLWNALLHAASIASFFALARRLRIAPAPAWLGALAYAVAPLHLKSFVTAGHWQLAVSFFLAPLLARETFGLARAPSARGVATLALLVAWSLLADNERTVTIAPVLATLFVFEWRRAFAPRAAIVALVGAGMLGVMISAAGTGPLLLELRHLALANDVRLFPAHAPEFLHPLFALDGGDFLYASGAARPAGAAGVRGSFALVVSAAAAATWAAIRGRRIDTNDTPLFERGAELGAVLLLVVWLGTARPAWIVSSFALYPESARARMLAGALVVAFAVALGWLVQRRARSFEGSAVRVALVVALFCVPANVVLAHVPIASSIANVRWFLHVNLPLVTALLLALGADALVASEAPPLHRAAPAILIGALFGLDVLVNAPAVSALDPNVRATAEAADRAMLADAVRGRWLPMPYVESDARIAYMQGLLRRPGASSWLLWSAPRASVARLAGIQAGLAAADPAVRRAALADAARANVRFIVALDHDRGVNELARASALTALAGTAERTFRNELHEQDELVTSGGRALPYVRFSPDRVAILDPPPGPLVVAESFYPYWVARRGDRTLPIREVGGFIEIDVPPGDLASAAPVELRYERPPSDRAFAIATALGLCGALVLLRRRRRVISSLPTRS